MSKHSLPKYVYRDVMPSGNVRHIFRKPGFMRATIKGAFGTQEFNDSYEFLLNGGAVPGLSARESKLAKMTPVFAGLLKKAKYRAMPSGLPFDISLDEVIGLHDRQMGKCALTGMAFSFTKAEKGRRNPFAPSLDRIVPALGYTVSNVRLTTLMANIARSDFSDDDFRRMRTNRVRNRATRVAHDNVFSANSAEKKEKK